MSPEGCRQDLQYRLLLRCFLLQEEATGLRASATKLKKENDDLNLKYAVAVLKGKGGLVTGARIMEELDRLKAECNGGGA